MREYVKGVFNAHITKLQNYQGILIDLQTKEGSIFV